MAETKSRGVPMVVASLVLAPELRATLLEVVEALRKGETNRKVLLRKLSVATR